MTNITYRDGVSIGVLVVYLPALAIAVFLSIRHGFTRSSGWRFLIIFALARIIGACLQIATINNPTDTSLYIGYATVFNIAISPLELTTLGLLSRIITSIRKARNTVVTELHLRLLGLLVTVGLVLGIVGGVQSGEHYDSSHGFKPRPISKVGLILFIVAFVGIVAATAATSLLISHAEPGEKRILLAVGFSLPFLLVRLIYSVVSIFANPSSFNSITGNVTILLCMALLEELMVVGLYESVGLTLKKLEKTKKGAPKNAFATELSGPQESGVAGHV